MMRTVKRTIRHTLGRRPMKYRWTPLVMCVLAVIIGCARQSETVPTEGPASVDKGTTAETAADARRVRIRVATFNASLYRDEAGELTTELRGGGSEQARQVAEIVQRVRPDLLLVNEIDYELDGVPAKLLRDDYFAVGQNGQQAIEFPYVFSPPVNTGVASGQDLNLDGNLNGPDDCHGFGLYPGQYGLAVFSRLPIDLEHVRTFQTFLWRDMPGATVPRQPASGTPYYPSDIWNVLRLSSKNHCDVPIQIGDRTLHFLVSHPTPPVFDGPEDRNGARNSDEIRFWGDYVTAARGDYIYDDRGNRGGLAEDALFVIAGDLNSDPHDGDSRHSAIQSLLALSQVHGQIVPRSHGAVEAAEQQGGANDQHRGLPQHDTSDFNDRSSGNLRVDYVLPAQPLSIKDAGVFWPAAAEDGHNLIKVSDHRLVWVDVEL